jgi:hypothetical protein
MRKMKIGTITFIRSARTRVGSLVAYVAAMAAVIAALSFVAEAVVVQTTNRVINADSADFGSGYHSGGSPSGGATVTYDWNNSTGQLVSTGRVRGTLYWDSLFGDGCARLTIRFRSANNVNIASRIIDECGPGGDANNAANRTVVDESFSSVNLYTIVLHVAEIRGGSVINPKSLTITQVTEKNFPVIVDNGQADFGDGFHAFGIPQEAGRIIFRRNLDGTVTGSIEGILYWDSASNESCARLITEFRNANGTMLASGVRLNCGPGGNANDQANQLLVRDSVFTSGFVSQIRIRVETLSDPADAEVRTYNFAGLIP